MTTALEARKGTFDKELFARFRAAPCLCTHGETRHPVVKQNHRGRCTFKGCKCDDFRMGALRRMLLNQLIAENEPLVITIVDQLSGRGTSARRRTMSGCGGFYAIEFEDAMQAGRIAFGKAMDQYDPTKSGVAGYFLIKCRHELQNLELHGLHLAHTPRGRESERAHVDLVGESLELDGLAAGDLGGSIMSESVTPEDLARWQTSGEWPESLEEHLAATRPPPPKVLRGPRRQRLSLPQFVAARLRFARGLRIARVTLLATYEIETRRAPEDLVLALRDHDVGSTKIRVPWSETPVPAFGGVALTSA